MALSHLVVQYESNFCTVALQFMEEEKNYPLPSPAATGIAHREPRTCFLAFTKSVSGLGWARSEHGFLVLLGWSVVLLLSQAFGRIQVRGKGCADPLTLLLPSYLSWNLNLGISWKMATSAVGHAEKNINHLPVMSNCITLLLASCFHDSR